MRAVLCGPRVPQAEAFDVVAVGEVRHPDLLVALGRDHERLVRGEGHRRHRGEVAREEVRRGEDCSTVFLIA